MAVKENMTIRIDPQLKEDASELFEALGLNLSIATALFYRQALRCHGIPFDIKIDVPNEKTIETMTKAENNEDIYGPYDNLDDLWESLNA